MIEIETSNKPQAVEQTPTKQTLSEGPAVLPPHIRAIGEHRRLAASTWWIGCACPAYKEVAHLHGIVIYNRDTHVFLLPEEARAAQAFLLQECSDT